MRPYFNPYPKYLQVRRILLSRIERRMKPGEQLPTEHALCAEFSVSRETIRAALQLLEQDGIIERTRGRGTFIARLPAERPEQRLTGLAEDFSALNLDTDARILFTGEAPTSAAVAAALGLAEGTPLFQITRVRNFEGVPLAYYEAYLPPAIGRLVAERDLTRTSIRSVIGSALRISCWEESQTIEALTAEPEIASLLAIAAGAPLLCLTRLYLSAGQELVVYFRSLYRADRYFYTAQLAQRPHEGNKLRGSSASPRRAPKRGR